MFSIDFDAKIDFSFDSTKQFSVYLTEIIVENVKMSSFCFFPKRIAGNAVHFASWTDNSYLVS